MNSEVSWVLVSSGTQVQPQIILNPDYRPGYLSLSYDYGLSENTAIARNFVKSHVITHPVLKLINCLLYLAAQNSGILDSGWLKVFYRNDYSTAESTHT